MTKKKCLLMKQFQEFASENLVDKFQFAFWYNDSINMLVRLDINGNKLIAKFGQLGFSSEVARMASTEKGFAFC